MLAINMAYSDNWITDVDSYSIHTVDVHLLCKMYMLLLDEIQLSTLILL